MRTYAPLVSVVPSGMSCQVLPDFFCNLMPSIDTLLVTSIAARGVGASSATSGVASSANAGERNVRRQRTTNPISTKNARNRPAREGGQVGTVGWGAIEDLLVYEMMYWPQQYGGRFHLQLRRSNGAPFVAMPKPSRHNPHFQKCQTTA